MLHVALNVHKDLIYSLLARHWGLFLTTELAFDCCLAEWVDGVLCKLLLVDSTIVGLAVPVHF